MNSKHNNINFSFETEKDEQMPFLDVNVFRENGKFVTNVYRKETFTGVYTNFSSFIPLEHKFGLVYTLLHRCFCLQFLQTVIGTDVYLIIEAVTSESS